MRKLLIPILVLALLSACAAPAADVSTSPSPEQLTSSQADTSPTPAEGETAETGEEGEFRARVASPADVQGVVTSIVGNEVTLKLIEPLFSGGAMRFSSEDMPEDFDITQIDPENLPEGVEMPEGFDPGMLEGIEINGDESGGFSVTLPEDFDMEEMQQRAEQYFSENGESGEGRTGGGAPQGGRRITGGGMSGVEIEVTYTGEELSVTIPVGMLSATPSKKQILMLWKDEDGEIINVRLAGTAKE